jgi:capsular exopolysaccharide synthesis family protein
MLRVLRGRAYVVVPIVLACTAAALVLAHVPPKKYTAWARLLVEPRTAHFISADAEGNVASAGEVELRTQSLVVRSLPVARRVVRMLRLTERGPIRDAWDESTPLKEDEAANALLETITVDPVFRTRCLEVSCETTDPKSAAKIADAFAEAFVRENIERRSERLTEAKSVYALRYPELDRKLQEAEAKLLRFQEEHLVVSSAQPEATLRQRELQLLKHLSEAQKERVEREALLMQLRPEGDAAGTARDLARTIGAEDPWVRQLLDTRLKQASIVVELRKSYSDGHRELESAKARLVEIEAELGQAARSYVSRAESAYRASLWKEKEIKRLLDEHRDHIGRLHQQIAKYEALRQRRDSLRSLLDPIARGQAEMELAASLDIANTRVIEPAQTPDRPSKPRRLNYAFAGLVIGFILGAGLAYIIDALDETVRTPADVRRAVSLQTIGTVSVMSRQVASEDADRALAMAKLPDSVASEQFRSIRTSILSAGASEGGDRGVVILVTSPGLGEGKTTVSLNCAIAFAQLGLPVAVVDGDLRRSSVHKLLGISRSLGLIEFLEGKAELSHVIRKPPDGPNIPEGLSVVTAGRETRRPAELLSGPRCREIIEALRAKHRVVLMDSPPVIPVADARDLTPLADFVLVVVGAGKTRRRALERTCELLGVRNGGRIGVVINNVTPSLEKQYGYSRYGYSYRSHEGGS